MTLRERGLHYGWVNALKIYIFLFFLLPLPGPPSGRGPGQQPLLPIAQTRPWVYRVTFSLKCQDFRDPNKNSNVTDQWGIAFSPKGCPARPFWSLVPGPDLMLGSQTKALQEHSLVCIFIFLFVY